MRAFSTALILCLITGPAWAAESCKLQATNKKLAGAALTSFMTKCERDMTTACAMQASERKIFGAAKTSFTKKCVQDSVGN